MDVDLDRTRRWTDGERCMKVSGSRSNTFQNVEPLNMWRPVLPSSLNTPPYPYIRLKIKSWPTTRALVCCISAVSDLSLSITAEESQLDKGWVHG